MDGWIRIGTDVETKTFDNQIEQCEKELQELQAKIENPDTIQIDTKDYDTKINEAKEQLSSLKTLASKGDKFSITGISRAEDRIKSLNTEKDKFVADKKAEFITKAESQAEKLRNKLVDLNEKKNKLTTSADGGFLNNIINRTNTILGQIAKWGLAVFGVRTAYRAVSQAMSIISQYDAQIGADIQYIKYALAMTLQPVIQGIISLVYKALSLIGLLIKNLTGVNIFKNSGVDKFQAGMKSGVASSKKIKENLNIAKFDEITKLSNTSDSSVGAGGGGGGIATPSFDLSDANKEVEAFYNKVKDIWESIGEDFDYAINNPKIFDEAFGNWGKMFYGITMMAKGAYDVADGVFKGIDGIIKVLTGIATGDMNLVFEGFKTLGSGIWSIVKGLVEFIGGVITTILGLVYGLVKTVIETITALVKTILGSVKNILTTIANGLLKAVTWIYNSFISPILKFITNMISSILTFIGNFFTNIRNVIKNLINIIYNILLSVITWINNNFITPVGNFFKTLWNTIVNVFSGVGAWFGNVFTNAKNFVINAFSGILGFIQSVWNSIVSIFGNIGARIGDTLGNSFKGAINGALSIVERLINNPIRAINNLLDVINTVPGVHVGKLNTVKLPRLASGGIVNLPGRGVPVGSAITGESGEEGVLPLTNETTMERLGGKIGKYINLTVNLTSKLDGRILAKEVVQINNQNSFIRNR